MLEMIAYPYPREIFLEAFRMRKVVQVFMLTGNFSESLCS